jgi:hypothetical protein
MFISTVSAADQLRRIIGGACFCGSQQSARGGLFTVGHPDRRHRESVSKRTGAYNLDMDVIATQNHASMLDSALRCDATPEGRSRRPDLQEVVMRARLVPVLFVVVFTATPPDRSLCRDHVRATGRHDSE